MTRHPPGDTMPTFYAMIAASASSLLINGLLKESMGVAGAILASLAWVVVFYVLKKWLTDLRP
jgi:hypothetical protein